MRDLSETLTKALFFICTLSPDNYFCFFTQTNVAMLGILLIVYILAINFYAFLYMRKLKSEKPTERKKHDNHISLVALLGGGPTVFACMFIYKKRLDSLFLMLAIPVLTALHAYLWYFGFRYGFGIPRWR